MGPNAPAIDLRVAVGAWTGTWILGQLLGGGIVALGGATDPGTASIRLLALGLIATWTAYLAGVWWAGTRPLAGADLRTLIGGRVARRDLWALPVGAAAQVLALPALYAPLRAVWPEVFDAESVERNARRLVDAAVGVDRVLLVLVVVVGAPLVEEIVYRGMLQRAWVARRGPVVGVLVASVWFAVIHFRPVEYPGLFLAGLIFGSCLWITGRLGTAIAAHMGFNMAGLILVSWV